MGISWSRAKQGILLCVLGALSGSLSGSLWAATVQTFSPVGEVAQVRQARATFSESMVRFGDPRLPAPVDIRCAETGTGRWVDDKTWVYDFTRDLPPGTRCGFTIKPGLKSIAGNAVTGTTSWDFNTGGPAIVRAYPSPGEYQPIEEEQVFALLLNGAASAESITRYGYCEAAGIQERIALTLVTGPDRDAILKAVNLMPEAARAVTVRCQRPLPPDTSIKLVWGKGIATPGGVPSSADRRLAYKVRPAFTASFTCERENAQADCLPIRPLRVEFSAPVPRALAEQIVLKSSDGDHKPALEQNRGEETGALVGLASGTQRKWYYFFGRSKGTTDESASQSGVSAVEFRAPLPENADVRIEIPAALRDDSGRALINASLFPLKTRTAGSPPLAKFAAAPFGILELNAEPVLPVTVRHVEADLAVKGVQPGGGTLRDIKIGQGPGGDAEIIAWMGRIKRYHEASLRKVDVASELGVDFPELKKPDAAKGQRKTMRYGAEEDNGDPSDRLVETRTLSLLARESSAQRMELPKPESQDPRPFEVIGVPLPQPGFYVVEIESQKLGAALLGKPAPMYVRTSALVTNLGVHFKLGKANSAVWVTTLDRARPVDAAQIQISDCRGKPVWNGVTDTKGYALVPRELPPLGWQYCRDSEQGYFISARKTDDKGRADMAFVWTTWNTGIESWRFHVSTSGYGSDVEPLLLHTVLDRRLLRAGQTVSMKHYARLQQLTGFALPKSGDLPDKISIVHEGSNTKYDFPLEWRSGRYAETTFKIPEDAKLGMYDITLSIGKKSFDTGNFRVEEFRLPVMVGRIVPPKAALIQPQSVPLSLQVNYGNGGGASDLPVQVSAQVRDTGAAGSIDTEKFPGFRFEAPRKPNDPNARSTFSEEYVDEDDDDTAVHPRSAGERLVADKLAVKLDKNGAGTVTLNKLPEVSAPRELLVQATYADPNGEIQTLSQTLPLWPSALVLGVRTDRWVSVNQKLATQMLVLDTAGKPQAGVSVRLHGVSHRVTSTRKRLVGGFYAYDNQNADKDLGTVCTGTSDARGLVFCEAEMDETGEVELIAEASDSTGHAARAAASVWVTRQGEIWFGGDNQDRMDVIPEQRSYAPGQTARFQVRMPFRTATALVAIERNGVIETRTVELNGKDPMIEVPVKAEWAPNVYVSVLAVRGRIREVPWYSLFTWGWRAPSEWWRAWRDEGRFWQAPTAMVDLSKPAFKYGVAEIEVGTDAHRLKVEVTPDKATYAIRATSQVRIKVTLPDGRPAPAGTEVALAAVDEALLELLPNTSTDLMAAMIRHRDYGIETATAQMQIIGKRHYGRKAAPPGGGGGQFPTRELFDTLLLWNPHVVLDDRGEATVAVPLNDSLTSFRIVAVADAVVDQAMTNGNATNVGLFGTGSASIRATQDLQIVSGLPPLVREGDRYRAMLTLRNTTPQDMDVKLSAQVSGDSVPASQQLHVAANSALDAGWDVVVPFNVKQLDWTISAESSGKETSGKESSAARDRMKFTQKVAEAIPVTVQQATLMQLDRSVSIPIAPPAGALADATGSLRGGIEVALKPKLADGLPGVRDYFYRYPWNCLEQKASIAIGLRDVAAWRSIAGQIPLYLDRDGLANYFPPSDDARASGSDTLTAYLLSLSSEASQLGQDYSIPDDTRAKMEAGLIGFVEGRVKRDFWMPAFLKNGDLDVRKLAALEALSRTGKVQPRMLGSIQILPNQWPTGAVIDWLMVLDRVKDIPERDKRIAEAEQILRARLNVQGTRLGFLTERDDSWWWLMTNGDVNSTRMVVAVLDHPGWRDDLPRIVTGTLQRQQNGRWSTTVANAWGSVAIERFSQRFERDPVTGSTRAGFDAAGAAPKAIDWSKTPSGGLLALGWPAGFGVKGNHADTAVKVTQEGGGKPWVTFTSRAAVPLTAPISTGYRITKTITPVEEKVKGKVSRGDVWRVHVDIDAQADMTWVVVNDPIPAGATLLGSGLGRDAVIEQTGEKEDWRGWLAYQERSFEAFRAYYHYVPKGHFSVEYTLRLNNPGSFGLPQTRVEAMYAPEMFGEYPNAAVKVE